MDASITNYLLTQGVLGLGCIVAGVVIVYQQKKYDKLQEKVDAINEKRIADAIAARDKIIEPMERLTALSEKIYDNLPRRN